MDYKELVISALTGSAFGGFILYLPKVLFKGKVDSRYNKELAAFNAAIAKEAADRQEDFQRKIYDFTLYAAKKHELYPEIFKQIHEIHKDLQTLDRFPTANLFQDLPSQDKMMPFLKKLEKVLHSKALSGLILDEDFIKTLEATTSFGIDECVRLARFTVQKGLSNEILKNIQSLENLFTSNLLYFSEDATSYIEPIIMSFHEVLREGFYSEDDMARMKLLLSGNVDKLKEILKKEISVGYYSS